MKLLLVVSFCCLLSFALHADASSASSSVSSVPAPNKAREKSVKPVPAGRAVTTPARDSKAISSGADASITPPPVNTRYGVFDALDKRSVYGQGVFPEPFLVDDSDGELNEARLDWLHTGGPNNMHSDRIHGEFEKGFGQLTLELETVYERDSEAGEISEGMDNVDLGARYPFYQWVSADGDIDNTFGIGMELGIPTHTQISHTFEIVPKVFDDLKFQNFTLQSLVGYSVLAGHGGSEGETEGGINNLEFGFVFGYTIDHDQLVIPGVQQLVPVFELSGEHQLNKDDHGGTNVVGDVGFRANLDTIGPVQPRLGIVFVFPVDYGARQEQSWGIDTSLVFEY